MTIDDRANDERPARGIVVRGSSFVLGGRIPRQVSAVGNNDAAITGETPAPLSSSRF